MKPVCRISLYFLAMLPGTSEAAVTINEVAWMGDSASANHEWIELYNSGEAAVSLDGWTINDGMNLEIALSGEIPPLSYVVLERTSEESAPGIAFLIYTGALVNTGATLVMRDTSAQIVEQVAGGEDWKDIGGDNETKETAQYTNAGWITAPGTPGKENIASGPVNPGDDEDDTDTSEESSSRSSRSEGKILSRVPAADMSIQIELPSHVYVNEPVNFFADVVGVGNNFKQSLRYTWNFGDTYAERGQRVTHAYEYAGTYVVQVWAAFGEREAVSSHTITVLPVTLSLTRNHAGDVQIHNDAVYPVDISRYVVKGQTEVLLPKGTVLLPRGTITVAGSRLEKSPFSSPLVLFDAAKVVVSMLSPTQSASTIIAAESTRLEDRAPVVSATREDSVVAPTSSTSSVSALVSPLQNTDFKIPSTKEPVWPFYAMLITLTATLMIIWLPLRRPKEESVTLQL